VSGRCSDRACFKTLPHMGEQAARRER